MLIQTTKSVANSVRRASIAVDLTSLEQSYCDAYGEPQIDLNGTITYVPSSEQTPPDQIPMAVNEDIDTPPLAGSAANDSGLGLNGLVLKGSGVFPHALDSDVGFLHYALEVTSDFECKANLLSVHGGLATSGTDPSTVDGFRAGIAVRFGADDDAPGLIFGWGSHNTAFNVALWQRTVAGAAYTIVNQVARSTPYGVFLRLTRTSLDCKAEYSFDNGTTWVTLATVTLSQQTYRVGLFVNSGTTGLATALFNQVSLTPEPSGNPQTFTIAGTKMVYIASQSPHTFAQDGKTDPQAEAKVAGWATTIQARLAAAKTTLLLNPQPESPDTSVAQV